MNFNNKMPKLATLLLLGVAFVAGCEKINHPGLGTYPKDSQAPGGPLKFYAAFDGINADSIRANFASVDSNTAWVTGVSGQAVQFNPQTTATQDAAFAFLQYPNANDFASAASSFSVCFWLNCPLKNKDNVNAEGILALASTSNFWGEITVYADHSTGGPSDSMDLKFHFANGTGDNWDFSNYVKAARWPHMYDGNWHHVAFVYDATSKTGTMYRDGVQFDKKTNEVIVFDGNASSLILGGFQEAGNIKDTYGNNTWMNSWRGALDNVRLYSEALQASDVQALYSGKQ